MPSCVQWSEISPVRRSITRMPKSVSPRYSVSPSTATGVAWRLSAPRDCHDPRTETSNKSILMTPASGVAMYAMP